MSTTNETGNILVVCLANVCRSVLAELVLNESLGDAGTLEVRSAGVKANGAMACRDVADRRPAGRWRNQVAAHTAYPLVEEDIANADLILTACVASRGAVAKIAPESRHRTFTLNEAVWLGREHRPATTVNREAVRSFASYLDDRRALDGMPPAPVRRWWRRHSTTDPLSIPDGHNLGDRAHRKTLDAVEQTTRRIAAQLAAEIPS